MGERTCSAHSAKAESLKARGAMSSDFIVSKCYNFLRRIEAITAAKASYLKNHFCKIAGEQLSFVSSLRSPYTHIRRSGSSKSGVCMTILSITWFCGSQKKVYRVPSYFGLTLSAVSSWPFLQLGPCKSVQFPFIGYHSEHYLFSAWKD